MKKILQIHPEDPDLKLLAKAGNLIQNQGLVVFPTQGLYGLGANALDPVAVEKVFHAKKRPESNPLLILIHELEQLESLTIQVPDQAKKLIKKFWPGSLTMIFQAGKNLPERLLGNTSKIGIRMPAHPIALALAQAAKVPITGTSANISGTPPCSRIRDLSPDLLRHINLMIDVGPLSGGPGSTVVDVTCSPPRIIRSGRIPAQAIFQTIS